jgi:hypothetical protein
MSTFKQLEKNSDIQALIKSTFDADLPVTGSWGYSPEEATIIKALPEGMTLPQIEQMLTTIRAHLEMNITQEAQNRYSAINANERKREEDKKDTSVFNKVTYEITGIKEAPFKAFMKEYKEGYGKEDFDLNAHFKRRKEATLTREVAHYFEVSALQ